MNEIYEFIIKLGKNFLAFSLGALLIGGTSYLVTKYFKYIFFAIIGCVAFYLVAASINELRGQFLTFRFENFKDAKELKLFLNEKFPTNSDALALKHMLEEGGAKCKTSDALKMSSDKDDPEGFRYLYNCEYSTGFFSFHFLESFDLGIYADINNHLLRLWLRRIDGIDW